MVRSAKVQNFLKLGGKLHYVYTEAEWMPPLRVFWHSRVASGLKCWPIPQCRDQTSTINGIEISQYRQHCSEHCECQHWSETPNRDIETDWVEKEREEEEQRKRKAGCMMMLIPMRVQKPRGFFHSTFTLSHTAVPLLFLCAQWTKTTLNSSSANSSPFFLPHTSMSALTQRWFPRQCNWKMFALIYFCMGVAL